VPTPAAAIVMMMMMTIVVGGRRRQRQGATTFEFSLVRAPVSPMAGRVRRAAEIGGASDAFPLALLSNKKASQLLQVLLLHPRQQLRLFHDHRLMNMMVVVTVKGNDGKQQVTVNRL
jgi:Mrp family chromosome partitioning ATPase